MIAVKRRTVDRRLEGEGYQSRKLQKVVIPTLAIRRRTFLFGFLVVLCQYAAVDSVNMLPAIILFYSMGLALSLELMSGELKVMGLDRINNSSPSSDHIIDPEEEEEKQFRQLLALAQFEYFVLKRRPQTRFARIKDQDGNLHLYAM